MLTWEEISFYLKTFTDNEIFIREAFITIWKRSSDWLIDVTEIISENAVLFNTLYIYIIKSWQ